MNFQKVLLILVSPILLELIVACCDCPATATFSYTNCSLEIESIDNSGPSPISTDVGSIRKEAFGLRVRISRSEAMCKRKSNSLFMSSAYAFSCYCPPAFLYFPEDSIVSIHIETVFDFDMEHPSGSDISSYFQAFRTTEFFTIPEQIENLHANENTLIDFTDPTLEFDLLLINPPDVGTEHQFAVKIELSDGRVLEEKSQIIQLQ